MLADIEFRKLELPDASAMRAMEMACFSTPWSLEQCKKALAQENFFAYGLWQKYILRAYISCFFVEDEMEILNLAVAPALRRKGFAFYLLDTVLQVGAKMGMQKVALEVRATNKAAISLYEKAGFYKTGERRNYYPDNGETALIYNRQI